MSRGLELGVLGSAREGDDIADVLHARDEEDEALEAEAEACVGAGAPSACVEIPPEMGHVHLAAVDFGHELVVAFLAD